MGAGTRPRILPADGWPRLGNGLVGDGHRGPRGSVRPILPVTSGFRAALLFLSARIHGRHARHRAVRQFDPTGVLLGVDESVLVFADRLLVPKRAGPRWCTNGAHRDLGRRALPVCRRPDTRAHRWEFRSRPGTGVGRNHSCAFALHASPHPDIDRCADKERPVSLSILASSCDGGADSRFGVSPFGNHGESGCFPASTPLACAGRNERMALARSFRRTHHFHPRRVHGAFPAGSEGAAGLFHHQSPRPNHPADRP